MRSKIPSNQRVFTSLVVGLMMNLGVSLVDEKACAQSEKSSALTIADLAAYRAALAPSETNKNQSVRRVTFRDLWQHPESFRGSLVQVEGRLARRFRQGKVGEFPPLVENWIFNETGEPLCVVHPDREEKGRPALQLGDFVRFQGTYLRTISYQGSDVARLAPLIVGPFSPLASSSVKRADSSRFRNWNVDWTVGLAAAAVVVLVLGRRHLTGAALDMLPRHRLEPPPEFVEGALDLEGRSRTQTEGSD